MEVFNYKVEFCDGSIGQDEICAHSLKDALIQIIREHYYDDINIYIENEEDGLCGLKCSISNE